jgi:alcohol dehydrogenase YqhD (iron-dependent ADH family)
MENFNFYNPVSIHFGKDVLNELADTIKLYGNNILLVYGKGSVVKNGYYKQVVDILNKNGIKYTEISGIKPNPVDSDVDEAVKIGRQEKVQAVLALGGGSVIDSSKAMALCIPENLSAWEVLKGRQKPEKALPLITILTLAATGTEMNHFSVLQNHQTNEKLGFRNPLMYPKHSFLDPQFTITVPKNYTAYGIADIIAHAFEGFFGGGNSPLADKFAASIITECIKFAPLVLNEPDNYEYRANILLQSTYALNGTTTIGKISGDWGTHAIGHTLSLLYDIPHGASLSIAYPAWFKLMKHQIPDEIKRLAQLIFGLNDIDLFIENLEQFYISIETPVRLEDAGIKRNKKNEIVELMKKNQISGFFHKFSNYEKLTELMYR